ncbi:MAG TPA: glutamate mutase L [Mycobacteriales bacterium]|nr:glutamate mutase L [Mycobacteriales bacterium]
MKILLVDVGSTVVKMCMHETGRGLGAVEVVARRPDLGPGEQVRALVDDRRADAARSGLAGLRICSSANGGIRVGVLGLSRRHSVAAATRAAVASGGNVAYERLLGAGLGQPGPVPPVDLLVLVGGLNGADHRYLREALAATKLADFPHDVLVWAGTDAPDIVSGLPVDYVVANVLDEQLRPAMEGLADLIHHLYVSDLVDRKGLRALAGITDTPIWPTPAVVALAAERLTTEPIAPAATPFVIIDIGGATTDVVYCAELRAEDATRISPGESIVRQVFTDLGVAGSLPGLRHRLATDPGLLELVTAVAPDRARALYQDICEGAEGVLATPVAFLACLFLALRRLTNPAGPHLLQPGRATSFVITGGAWTGTPEPAIRRVIGAGCGMPDARWSLHVDRAYSLWAHGLLTVPPDPVP